MIEQRDQLLRMDPFSRFSIQLLEQIEMRIKVDRVAMIVTGLFEINAVRFNLFIQRIDQDPSSRLAPVLRFTEFR